MRRRDELDDGSTLAGAQGDVRVYYEVDGLSGAGLVERGLMKNPVDLSGLGSPVTIAT